MGLNPVKGNMYDWVTHTWNTVKGECPHGCTYCYCKRFGKQRPVRFDAKELKADLGSGNFIFVGSSCDMYAEAIPKQWIWDTLEHCRKHRNNYLFQSKNPTRILKYKGWLPYNCVCGTTIETNRIYPQMGNAPRPKHRMSSIHTLACERFKTMVTLEPIMDFDLSDLLSLIYSCQPEWVNIGADSQGHKLPEPEPDKILTLIEDLQKVGIEVRIKPNLKRLLK